MVRVVHTLILAGTMALASSGYQESIAQDTEQKSHMYTNITEESKDIDTVINAIITYHETHTNVQYGDARPSVLFDPSMHPGEFSRYDVQKEAILLHPRYKEYDLSLLIHDINTRLRSNGEERKLSELREVLSHELGHFLMDIYVQDHTGDSWLKNSFENGFKPPSENLEKHIISEGVAEYFGKIFYVHQDISITRFQTKRWSDPFHDSEFQRRDFIEWVSYMGGFNIVEPIMKGREHEGITWLLENELTITPLDLSVVTEYKAKGIEELKDIAIKEK